MTLLKFAESTARQTDNFFTPPPLLPSRVCCDFLLFRAPSLPGRILCRYLPLQMFLCSPEHCQRLISSAAPTTLCTNNRLENPESLGHPPSNQFHCVALGPPGSEHNVHNNGETVEEQHLFWCLSLSHLRRISSSGRDIYFSMYNIEFIAKKYRLQARICILVSVMAM